MFKRPPLNYARGPPLAREIKAYFSDIRRSHSIARECLQLASRMALCHQRMQSNRQAQIAELSDMRLRSLKC